MRTPLSWIELYTPISDIIAEKWTTELAHQYSIHTAEIDDVFTHFIDKVVIGKVISCEKHPDSKKLSIVRVYLGQLWEETILTGAENIVNAKYVAVAVVGAALDNGNFVIGERKMAGMMSRGMICSDDELGLVSPRSEGIMELETIWDESLLESRIGESFFDLTLPFPGANGDIVQFPLRDTTFEIDNKFITNRPDLFSIIGNAREWGAVFDKNFANILSESDDIVFLSKNKQEVSIESDAVLAYSLLEVDNLTTESSPFGIKVMMERAGLSPKFDIVDVTNLILTEYGQPMHAFDADKVSGNISIRMAKSGEKLLALNNVEYTLTENDLVIADEKGPIALAGVIGGFESAVSESTTRVYFESATFDATTIRLTAQRHAIRTDASTRYEKSLDPTLAGKVFPRVMQYLQFLGKTPNIVSQFGYLSTKYNKNIEITVPYSLISQKAGIEISFETITKILNSLGFEIIDTNMSMDSISDVAPSTKFDDGKSLKYFVVRVPSWRATKDISIAEDIVEEILRIYGYENIPALPLSGDITIAPQNKDKHFHNSLLSFFTANNWSEVFNYSFTNIALQEKILAKNHEHLIAIQNAYTEDYTHMRDSLAPRLCINIANNLRHNSSLRFFEIGKIYGKNLVHDRKMQDLLSTQDSKPYGEKLVCAGISTMDDISSLRQLLDAFFVKIFAKTPEVIQLSENTIFFHPKACGQYQIGENIFAKFGRIHPAVAENFEIPDHTLYFEIYFDATFMYALGQNIVFTPMSQYQPIRREFNFVLDAQTPTGEVAKLIESVHPWIFDVVVDSIYEDVEKVGIGKKSVNFSCVVQSMEGTITDEEAKSIHEKVITTLESAGYKLRGF